MQERKIGWIPFSKLIRKDSKFEPCPVCGEQVIQGQIHPECQACKTQFRARKKFLFIKGFDIIHRKQILKAERKIPSAFLFITHTLLTKLMS